MTPKLKKRVKKKWVEALRSGKYEQGTGQLANRDRFCCLGVLCEVAIESGVPVERYVSLTTRNVIYQGSGEVAPDCVADWAFLAGRAPAGADAEIDGNPLSNWNDDGATFAEIADLIEEHL